MATVSQVTEAVYRARFDDQMTAGAASAERALNSLGATVVATDEKVTRSTRSAESWVKSADPVTAAANRAAAAQRALSQAQQTLSADLQAGGEKAQAAQRALDALSAKAQRAAADARTLEAAHVRSSVAIYGVEAASTRAGGGVQGLGRVMGQAGYQIQDFAVQVSAGQSALVALGQQGSQLLGVFGTGGAIAGAVLTVGILAAQLLGVTSATDRFSEAIDAQKAIYEQATKAADHYREGLDETGTALNRLADYYRSAGEAVRVFEERRVNNSRLTLATQQGAQEENILGGLRSNIASARGSSPQYDALGNATGATVEGIRQLSGGLLQVQQALAAFDASTQPAAERLAELTNRLLSASETAGNFRSSVLAAAQGLVSATPDILRMSEAQQQAATQFLALRQAAGDSVETLAAYARQLGGIGPAALAAATALNALAQGGIGAANDRIIVETQRAQAVIRATAEGGREAGQAMQDAGTRSVEITRRVTEAQSGYRAELERARVPEAQIIEALREMQGEHVSNATAAVDSSRQASAGLERQAAAARGARQAIQELYGDSAYQNVNSGLISLGAPDDTAFQAIQRNIDRAAEASRRETERATQEATRAAERQQQQADQFAGRWGDRLSEATTQGLFDGFKNGESIFTTLARTFTNLLRQGVSAALSQQVFTPLIGSVFGGGGSSAASSLGGAASGTSGGGFSLSSVSSLYSNGRSLLGGGGLGSFFPGGAPINTGYGFIDGAANYSLIAPTAGSNALGTAANSTGFIQGTGLAGEAGSFAGGAGAAVGSPGLSVAGALGPAAAIGGGLYGVYSGIQKGGVGGYTGAVGGAISAAAGAAILAGSAAFGPIGLAIGALVTLVGSLLPGQKPSGKGQEVNISTVDGGETTYGLQGARFSQGNQDYARKLATGVASIETELQKQLGYGLDTQIGAGVTQSRGKGLEQGSLYLRIGEQRAQFGNDEAGAKAFGEKAGEFLLNEFKTASLSQENQGGDKGSILRASGSITDLGNNLDWYENTYKALTGVQKETTQFAESLRSLVKPYDEAISKAAELGLATDTLSTKRGQQLEDALAPLLGKTASVQDQYAEGLKKVRENYEAVITVVGELGRATDDLRAAMANAETQYRASIQLQFDQTLREAKGQGYIDQIAALRTDFNSYSPLYSAAGRDPAELFTARLTTILGQLDTSGLENVVQQFRGVDDAAANAAESLLKAADAQNIAASVAGWVAEGLKQQQDAQAAALASQRSYSDAMIGIGQGLLTQAKRLRDEINSVFLSDVSPLSPTDRLAFAAQQFKAEQLDLTSYLREGSRAYGTSTEQYATLFADAVQRQTGNAARNEFAANAFFSGATTGFATGGSFEVAGAAGNDNLFLPSVRVQAGEAVNVTRRETMADMADVLRDILAEMRRNTAVAAGAGDESIARLAGLERRLASIETMGRRAAAA